MPLIGSQLKQLQNFCSRFEIDTAEIDSDLTYHENKTHLRQFLIKTLEDLAREYHGGSRQISMDWEWDEDYKELRDSIREVLMEQYEGVLMSQQLHRLIVYRGVSLLKIPSPP